MSELNISNMTCPLPLNDHPRIKMAHGGGGRMMQRLIEELFFAAFDNPALRSGHDGAVLELPEGRLVMTTDSYVVRPLFFPGGDIGALAVHGTVNDLAMCGARPLSLCTLSLRRRISSHVLYIKTLSTPVTLFIFSIFAFRDLNGSQPNAKAGRLGSESGVAVGRGIF